MLTTNDRRKEVLKVLTASTEPICANFLAEKYGVSRQVIVGDIAILRASGSNITSTPRGYILEKENFHPQFPYIGILAVMHDKINLGEELYTIVDFGATIIDVVIDHPIYGQLIGNMNISSRCDAEIFIKKIDALNSASLLSSLTGGIHIHHIGTKDEQTFHLIRQTLIEKGIALS